MEAQAAQRQVAHHSGAPLAMLRQPEPHAQTTAFCLQSVSRVADATRPPCQWRSAPARLRAPVRALPPYGSALRHMWLHTPREGKAGRWAPSRLHRDRCHSTAFD
eukprot:scaffold129445_cov60-Phaeocystis_antarctica.AAC.2